MSQALPVLHFLNILPGSQSADVCTWQAVLGSNSVAFSELLCCCATRFLTRDSTIDTEESPRIKVGGHHRPVQLHYTSHKIDP